MNAVHATAINVRKWQRMSLREKTSKSDVPARAGLGASKESGVAKSIGAERGERSLANAELPMGLSRNKLSALGVPYTHLLKVPGLVYLSIAVVNLLALILPISILQIYDRVIPNAASATLGALILILVLTAFCEAILRIARLYIDTMSAAQFSHNINVDALSRILKAPSDTFWSEPPSRVLERLEAVARLGNFFGGTARQISIDLPFSLIFLGAIALVGGWIVVIPIAIMLIFGAITLFYGRVLVGTITSKDAQDSRNFDFINEVLSGISTIKGHATESFMMRRFERLERASARLTYELITASDRAQIMAGTLGNITIIAIVSVGAVMAIEGSMTIGTLAACSMLSGRAIQPALRVAGVWNEYQRTRVTLRDAVELFAFPTLEGAGSAKSCIAPPEVTLSDATYLPGGDKAGFEGLNLKIRAGDIVSLCGPNGVGKSTLLRLIAGLTEPHRGAVNISGMPASVFREHFRNSIGYVSPETATFHGSILDNLTLFGGGCTQEDALATAQLLGLEEEIYRFPKGYATLLGASVVEAMPVGFVQRILIARALAQKPRLLILDEAQTFLDPQSDIRLRECLRDLRATTTVIVVTNKPDYVALADQVFDVSLGKVRSRTESQPRPASMGASA